MPPRADPEREAELARLLFELRWGDGFACRKCGHGAATQLRVRPRVWSCNTCRTHHSVTAGTLLHRCKLPLAVVFDAAVKLMDDHSVSARAFASQIGLRIDTAWRLLHRLRAGFEHHLPRLEGPISIGDVAIALRAFRDGQRRNEGEPERLYPVVLVAIDGELRAIATTSTDRWFRPLQLMTEHSDAKTFTYVPDHPVAMWMRTVLHCVHQTVTARWLHRYLATLAAIQTAHVEDDDAARTALRAVVRSPRAAFEEMRPPRNVWDASWDAGIPPMVHVRLDLLELPIRGGDRVVLRRGYRQVPGVPGDPEASPPA